MIYYADYEALERPRSEFKQELIPPWLNDETKEKIQIPLCFTACTIKGNICHSQDYNTNTRPISFLQFLDSIIRYVNHKTHTIYFHNLYYDFNIIICELMYNDFTQWIQEKNENLEYPKLDIIRDKVIDPEKIFIVMGDTLKRAVGVDIFYRGKLFQIRDTFRIISSSQDDILKSFGYELKPKIDFENLDINEPWEIVELRNRNRYDVISLSQCIEKFKKTLYDKYGAKGDTASSIALSAIKNMLGEKYDELFPIIAGTEFEELSRLAYNGGICQHTYHHEQGIERNNLYYLDINSSYPNTMREDVPFGIPTFTTEFTEQYSEYLIYVEFELNKPYIPCIRCSSAERINILYGLKSETYHKRDEFPHKFKGHLALTSYDILMLKRYYKFEMTIIKGFVYETNPIFKEFIEKLFREKYLYKKSGNKVMELAIKLILNSLYGKFAQDLSGDVQFITKHEKITIKCKDNKKIYCPLSSCIVSHARYNLMKEVNREPLNFVYCDTDSAIIFDKDKFNQLAIGNNLGQWSFEFDGKKIERLKILGKKNYIIEVDGKQYLKCVGLPNDRERIYNYEEYQKGNIVREIVDFDNFKIDSTFVIRKMVRVYGGIAMHYTTFTIKERKLMYG
jgi:hypothetical protein